jgi:hypothetical protein
MVPGLKPTGPMTLDKQHWASKKVPIIVALIRSPDNFTGPNADNSPFFINNIANTGVYIDQAGYPTYLERKVFPDGEHIRNTASFGGFPIEVRTSTNVSNNIERNQAFTIIVAGRWHQNDSQMHLFTGDANNLQINTQSSDSSSLVVRPICSAFWSVGYDVTIPITRVAEAPFAFGFSWSKGSATRTVAMHNGYVNETTGLPGPWGSTGSRMEMIHSGSGVSVYWKHIFLFADKMSAVEMKSLFMDPYQFLTPA